MDDTKLLDNPSYDPIGFLTWLKGLIHVKTDAALAYRLNLYPSTICRMRCRKSPIGLDLLVKVHDMTNLPIREIRKHMGITQ